MHKKNEYRIQLFTFRDYMYFKAEFLIFLKELNQH